MTDQAVTSHVEYEHEDEGHSIAAWVSVAVMTIGVAIGTVMVWMDDAEITRAVIVGGAVMAVGIILWPVLSLVGLGSKGR